MHSFRFFLIAACTIWLYGCAGDGKRVKTLVEEVCDQYGPASRECRDYRRSYSY